MKRLLSMHWTLHLNIVQFLLVLCLWAYPIFQDMTPQPLAYTILLNYCIGCLGYFLWKDIRKQYREEAQFLED